MSNAADNRSNKKGPEVGFSDQGVICELVTMKISVD